MHSTSQMTRFVNSFKIYDSPPCWWMGLRYNNIRMSFCPFHASTRNSIIYSKKHSQKNLWEIALQFLIPYLHQCICNLWIIQNSYFIHLTTTLDFYKINHEMNPKYVWTLPYFIIFNSLTNFFLQLDWSLCAKLIFKWLS